MSATIKSLGMLKGYTGGESERQVPAGITVRQALGQLGIPSEVVALVVVNGEMQDKDYLLQEGDAVRLMAVIGGG